MIKAYKFRVYPNKEQQLLFAKTFGCARFVYNYYLHKKIELYKSSKEGLSYNKCSADLTQLKKELMWLKEVDKWSLQNSLKNLDSAYQKFFKEHSGFPKFKSKKKHTVIRTQQLLLIIISNTITIKSNYQNSVGLK